jgi:hypothetical protein
MCKCLGETPVAVQIFKQLLPVCRHLEVGNTFPLERNPGGLPGFGELLCTLREE